mmetsp:Transcript_16481/g.51804  ORF Transcript_16481/g.51804 Transcript_16481/m.51804 type:complete len:323 (-) Transcript_16481:436-1404(-)
MPAHLDEEEGGASGQGEDSHTVGKVAPLNHETTLGIGASIPPGPLSIVRIVAPMEGSPHPGQADAQEDVHGVAARDVAHGVVRVGVLLRRNLRGKGVRQAGAEGHERDGRNLVGDAHAAAKEGRKVAHQRGHEAYHAQGEDEAEPAAAEAGGRDDCKEELPDERDGVDAPLRGPCLRLLLEAAIAADRGGKLLPPLPEVLRQEVPVHAAPREARKPGWLALGDDDNVADGPALLPVCGALELHAGAGIAERDLEALAALHVMPRAAKDADLDGPGHLSMPEGDGAFGVHVVPSCDCSALDGLVAAADLTASAVGADDAKRCT